MIYVSKTLFSWLIAQECGPCWGINLEISCPLTVSQLPNFHVWSVITLNLVILLIKFTLSKCLDVPFTIILWLNMTNRCQAPFNHFKSQPHKYIWTMFVALNYWSTWVQKFAWSIKESWILTLVKNDHSIRNELRVLQVITNTQFLRPV